MEGLLTTITSRTCAFSSYTLRTMTDAETKRKFIREFLKACHLTLDANHKRKSVIDVSILIDVLFVSFVFLTRSTSSTNGWSLLYPENSHEAL